MAATILDESTIQVIRGRLKEKFSSRVTTATTKHARSSTR